jgi:hypothetical protein
MPRYEVLQDYRSGGHGPWEQGSKIELDAEEAAWVNRDSSGTLKQIPGLGEESKPALQARAEELEVPKTGTKEELAERIAEAEAEAGSATPPAGEGTAEERQAGSQGAMTAEDHPGVVRSSSSRSGVRTSGRSSGRRSS